MEIPTAEYMRDKIKSNIKEQEQERIVKERAETAITKALTEAKAKVDGGATTICQTTVSVHIPEDVRSELVTKGYEVTKGANFGTMPEWVIRWKK